MDGEWVPDDIDSYEMNKKFWSWSASVEWDWTPNNDNILPWIFIQKEFDSKLYNIFKGQKVGEGEGVQRVAFDFSRKGFDNLAKLILSHVNLFTDVTVHESPFEEERGAPFVETSLSYSSDKKLFPYVRMVGDSRLIWRTTKALHRMLRGWYKEKYGGIQE